VIASQVFQSIVLSCLHNQASGRIWVRRPRELLYAGANL